MFTMFFIFLCCHICNFIIFPYLYEKLSFFSSIVDVFQNINQILDSYINENKSKLIERKRREKKFNTKEKRNPFKHTELSNIELWFVVICCIESLVFSSFSRESNGVRERTAKTQSVTITRQRTRQNWTEKIWYDWMERWANRPNQSCVLPQLYVWMCVRATCVCMSVSHFFLFVLLCSRARYEFLPTTFEMICCVWAEHPRTTNVKKEKNITKRRELCKRIHKHIDAEPHKPMNEATMEYKHPAATLLLYCLLFAIHSHTHVSTQPGTDRYRTLSALMLRRMNGENWTRRRIGKTKFSPCCERLYYVKRLLRQCHVYLCWKCIVVFQSRFPCAGWTVHSPLQSRSLLFHSFDNIRVESSYRFGQAYTHTIIHFATLFLSLHFTWHWQSTKNKYDTFIIFRFGFHFSVFSSFVSIVIFSALIRYIYNTYIHIYLYVHKAHCYAVMNRARFRAKFRISQISSNNTHTQPKIRTPIQAKSAESAHQCRLQKIWWWRRRRQRRRWRAKIQRYYEDTRDCKRARKREREARSECIVPSEILHIFIKA